MPAVTEQTLFMVVGVVSTIFVGRISKEAISAVGLVNVLSGFIMTVFVALSTGSTVLVARFTGEGDSDSAKEALRQTLTIGFIASVFLSILLYAGAGLIINTFFSSAEASVLNGAITYFRITMFTFPLALLNILVSGCLRGAGNTKTPMLIANAVNIINIVLGYVLIFGINTEYLNLSGNGITGAGAAVAISRGIGGILSIVMLCGNKSFLKINLFKGYKFKPDVMKRILKVGIPAAMEQVVMQGGFLVLQVIIAGMGTISIAVFQICMSINSISYIPVWGFGIGATTLIGQSLGASMPCVAEKCGWSTLKIAISVIVFLTALIFIFPDRLISIYNSDPEVIKAGASAIRIFSLSQPFLAVVVVISGCLRGAGDIKYVMFTSFVGIWGFRILLTVLLNIFFRMGINGLWIAYCADFAIRSVLYLLRFRKGRWKTIVV